MLSSLNPRLFSIWMAFALSCCGLTILLAPLAGSVELDWARVLSSPGSLDREIVVRARLPRILFAMAAGGALSSCGVVFQAVLRNPLASPFTLGVSGGASLGAVLAIQLGTGISSGPLLLPASSLAGALAVVSVVYLLSQGGRHVSPATMLLSGVVLNFLCSAGILLVQYFADFSRLALMTRWVMGGLDVYDYAVLFRTLPLIVPGMMLLLSLSRAFNVLAGGEEWASARGLNVPRTVTAAYFGASLVTAAVVAHAGPIGFVGLIVPHTLRLLVGSDHRLLMPLSFLFGGVFLTLCDTLARTIVAPVEIPVGIITALLGGPFFLWLLLRRKQDLFF